MVSSFLAQGEQPAVVVGVCASLHSALEPSMCLSWKVSLLVQPFSLYSLLSGLVASLFL